ncbi:MAG: Unknown protein [uncultured Sulfurovum sp.]|uniref:LysM domain-containing protein n=1 Tax=uncultured Sulfurovum sp. TaxID=269237 RepID=A0A6S6TXA4_9BACT|nr:MAG: Unknown protein [uncultured Sulfurovum sp.]
MKKTVINVALLSILLNAQLMAEELEIKLIDESEKSALFQQGNIEGTIIGCHDNAFKKELACAKKPKDAILSKLPTSQQIESTDLKNDDEREQIKMQLANILAELNHLKTAQKADRETIKQLKTVISELSPKLKIEKEKELIVSKQVIQEKIKRITPKLSKSKVPTLIDKKIKEISRTPNSVTIEVQRNESLSTYAEAYYGDNRKYYRIFQANKHILPASMILTIGDILTIPLD